MDRVPMVDLPRLGSNRATERYQPHWGMGAISEHALTDGRQAEPLAVIRRGPTGVGVSYEWAEPVGEDWHEVNGPEPMVQRATGA